MSRGPAWSGGLIVAGLLLAPAAVSEEIIRLKSGGMVRGTLTKQTATDVVVQTEMGTITLAPDAILSIEQEPDAEAPEQPGGLARRLADLGIERRREAERVAEGDA